MRYIAIALWLSGLVAIHVWVWTSSLISVRVGPLVIQGHTTAELMQAYSQLTDVPQTHVVVYGHTGRNTTLEMTEPNKHWLVLWPEITHWSIRARPVSGDHIHMAMSIWIGNEPKRLAEHDRNPIESVEYEQKPEICPVPGTVAYEKVWPHVGVHTHCDGLIHVHPWSAPRVFRQEGLGIRLGLWFDQVGIRYREHPMSLTFPDGIRHTNNKTHIWRVAEYKCFKERNYTVYARNIDQIWLGHAFANYVMWFGSDKHPPNAIGTHISALQLVGANGFDGNKYPQHCI